MPQVEMLQFSGLSHPRKHTLLGMRVSFALKMITYSGYTGMGDGGMEEGGELASARGEGMVGMDMGISPMFKYGNPTPLQV